MRRVNVDRMRRYVARTTPDRRRWRFTPEDMDAAKNPVSLVGQHLDLWSRRMALKHGDRMQPPEVTMWRTDDLMAAVVEARVRP